jgi:hypothetical protein
MNDATRRALRTLAQFVVAGGFTEAINAFLVDLDPAQKMAILAVLQLVVSFAQNYLEDIGAIPAALKAPPSPGANPVPDDAGPAMP